MPIEPLAHISVPLTTTIALVAVAVLATIWISMAVARRRLRQAFEDGLTREADTHAQVRSRLETYIDHQDRTIATSSGEVATLKSELAISREQLELRQLHLAEAQASAAALEARLEEVSKGFREKEALLVDASRALKLEFQQLAGRIFEEQGKSQSERITQVLSPLREQMQDFRKRVDEVYTTETRDRATLLAEVRNLQQASERVNQEAGNLARALKGDKRLQGNWGELVLERILEESGLRRDHEYFVQQVQRNDSGALKRPDVVIRLPDDKDIVIDAKMSLNAYELAITAEDDADRAVHIRDHLSHVRAHVQRLSEQDYDHLPGLRSLDFVLMFIPIEAAFTLAMEGDSKLFSRAFERRIVVVSPTTLMMTLRIIHNVWRYEKQSRHAQEIASRAGALYDKLRMFVEDMDRLGVQLDTASRTFASAYGRLASGKGNLVRQAELFRELGARVKKRIPKEVVERAMDGEDNNALLAEIDDEPEASPPPS